MAVGDVINVNTTTTSFQPAAGVEIMILRFMNDSNYGIRYGFTDGVNTCTTYLQGGTANYNNAQIGNKFGITNTNYWYDQAGAATKQGFSGIQIK